MARLRWANALPYTYGNVRAGRTFAGSWNNDMILVNLGECRLLQGKLLSKVSDLGFDPGSQPQAEILALMYMLSLSIDLLGIYIA
jgi:hypothetical protein